MFMNAVEENMFVVKGTAQEVIEADLSGCAQSLAAVDEKPPPTSPSNCRTQVITTTSQPLLLEAPNPNPGPFYSGCDSTSVDRNAERG